VPFVVQDYLRNAENITVTRLLYEDGYDLDQGVIAVTATSASTTIVTHLLHPTQPVNVAADLLKDSSLANDESGSFAISITGSYSDNLNTDVPGFSGAFTLYPTTNTPVSASIVSADNDYISKVFGKTPKSNEYPVYVQYENNNASGVFDNLGDVTVSAEVLAGYDFAQDYQTAATPWITSQRIGSAVLNLFKFHTLSHGTAVNYETKKFQIQTDTEHSQ
jgi:hypothetical protein